MASSKKATKKATRRRRGVKLQPTDLAPAELGLAVTDPSVATLVAQVQGDGGSVLTCYREPLGGHSLLLVALPVERVQPTPFQRDVSEGHLRKLTHAMDKTRRFLDPIILHPQVVGEPSARRAPQVAHATRHPGARCSVVCPASRN